ncbi:uncharacterized protein LOC131927760 [Physella acuta]|uniref:uncharacterized protein LOC131927760 n=1 Tax=Physella acuta TaxID=109671 RepID=UPI0027DCCC43|nr:uncharacterized protein LOC131927760 [Physella acuta]XP_059139539.1 uncharacterized protein LOC131927760 [Physella acuta]XP_059139540.1 uncharacterized protein LOC131927760 [Physella acuta]XP_059139541.1 uncharacterized protein LOC131927760 [Physella acuta]XP_059139542.1 uncharacterized protein LOC131927760 [Physella acuta]XP_059139543.1 uncharacterized protein LOC131927760 [Physella acuta]
MSVCTMMVLACMVFMGQIFYGETRMCSVCRPVDPGCAAGNVMPMECPGNIQHCYVYHLYIEDGGVAIFRGCTNITLEGDRCMHRTMNNGRSGIGCQSTCSWEACNSNYLPPVSSLDRNRRAAESAGQLTDGFQNLFLRRRRSLDKVRRLFRKRNLQIF